MNTREEWTDLFWTALAVANDTYETQYVLPGWFSEALDHLSVESMKSVIEKIILAQDLTEIMGDGENQRTDDVKHTRTWYKILSVPQEELPTLLGVREDLDDLIAERLKEEA